MIDGKELSPLFYPKQVALVGATSKQIRLDILS